MYRFSFSWPSRAGRNGGDTFGKFVKLFGKIAFWVAAIADAFRMAKGFLPVRVVPLPVPVPTRLLVPEDLSVSFIIFLAMLDDWDYLEGSGLSWDLLFSLDAEFSRCLVFVADVFCEEPLFVDEFEEFIVEFPFGVGTFN